MQFHSERYGHNGVFVFKSATASPNQNTIFASIDPGGRIFLSPDRRTKKTQPASFTGAAAGYTHNDSWFAGVLQQNYWKEDSWRFTGLAGYLDLKLELIPTESEDNAEQAVDWLVSGSVFQARISRRLPGLTPTSPTVQGSGLITPCATLLFWPGKSTPVAAADKYHFGIPADWVCGVFPAPTTWPNNHCMPRLSSAGGFTSDGEWLALQEQGA